MTKVQWSSRFRVVAMAAGLGVLAGVGGVYVRSLVTGNASAAAECQVAKDGVAALAPLAKGEVAAFLVDKAPARAPNLAFKDGKGQDRHLLDDFKGKVALVNLWATWCVPCRQEMPALDRLQAALGGERFEVVAVSTDLGGAEKPRQFLADTKIETLAFYHDPSGRVFQDTRQAGRAIGLPATMLVDKEGCILGHILGPAEWASGDARKLIEAALAR